MNQSSQGRKRVVIVGGVAGGAAAATRLRRLSEDAEITLIERGEHVSFANCGLPYHIGGVIAERDKLLVQTPEGLARSYGIDVRTRTEAVRIERGSKTLVLRRLADGAEEGLPYDALILSPGAEPIRPPLPGGDNARVFTLRNMKDMDAIKRVVDEEHPAHAVVVGGGYIGLEVAEALRERGVGVSLVELGAQVMGPADSEMVEPLHQQLALHGVEMRLGTSVTAVREVPDGPLAVELADGSAIAAGLVLLAIGVRPETKLAREAGLTLGERGGILVDDHMRTSDPDIYAVGDAVEVVNFVSGAQTLVPLAGPAARQGRIAAENVMGRDTRYAKTQGTAIIKVFDAALGMTGMSEKALAREGLRYEKVYVHGQSHAGYYPGAAPLTIKLLFDPEGGRILGAQVVGSDGVDKRTDVLATAIRAGMTVFDLQELELSYAPPFGSAKDPVNVAGFVAVNVLLGDMPLAQVKEFAAPAPGQAIVDVRTPAEFAAGSIPGAINLPVDDLRARHGELPRDRELLVYCQVGLRGYRATRILRQHGYTVRNLSGGFKIWSASRGGAAKTSGKPVPPGSGGAPKSEGPREGAQVQSEPAAAVARTIDATALQCPGPIMRLANELKTLEPGQAVAITTLDAGFAGDIGAWCQSTGNRLEGVTAERGRYTATVVKSGERDRELPAREQSSAAPAAKDDLATLRADPANAALHADWGRKHKTLVVFSSDFDKVMAAFIIANGAAAMGSEVTMFFTFWGLNVLRRDDAPLVHKSAVEKMFGWMMPRGPERLALSRMNMGGVGLRMIKGIMRAKGVAGLGELIASARAAGVRLVACSMSMDLMGIKPEELIEGVELGGVAMYLNQAEAGHVNLFVG